MTLPNLSRRGFLLGLGATMAAPAIARATSLMPVKVMRPAGPLTVYVDGTDADKWEELFSREPLGGELRPFKTIRQAMEFIERQGAPEGTEVRLAPGVYSGEHVTIPRGSMIVGRGSGYFDIRDSKITSDGDQTVLLADLNAVMNVSNSTFIRKGIAPPVTAAYGGFVTTSRLGFGGSES